MSQALRARDTLRLAGKLRRSRRRLTLAGYFWIAYLAPVLWLYAQLGADVIRWLLA